MLSKKYTCNFWVHVCGYFWVQRMRLLGACMRLRLGAKYAPFGCMYAATFGCMYAVVGCKSAETFGCKVCGCWVQVS